MRNASRGRTRLLVTIAGVLLMALALSGVTAAAGPGETGNDTIPPGFTKVTFIHTVDGPPEVAVEHASDAGAPPFSSSTAPACSDGATDETAQCDSFSWSGQYWEGAAVTYNVNLNDSGDDDGFLAAVQASAQTWAADADSDFDFTFGGTTGRKASSLKNRMDGNNDVTWESLSKYQNPIAVTIFWYYTSTGVVVEADLINNENLDWASNGDPDAYDVQNIDTHEFGHYLVLGDLYDTSDNALTMYGYGALGETQKSTLGTGDELGIAAIYATSAPTPTGSIAGTVTDGADGIGGASVSTGTGQSTTTAGDGSYTLSDVPTGSSTVTASADGYVGASDTTTVVENLTSLVSFTLALVPTGTITGTVTDAADSSLISGATVSTDTGEETTTASDGTYTLTDVPTGERTVSVAARGYGDASQVVTVTDGGTATASFALTEQTVATSVSVGSFVYSGEGGRYKDKHVSVTIALVDNLGGGAGGASISVQMDSDSGTSATGSGTTGSDGTITFTWSNAPGDCYTTTVTSVTSGDLTFDATGSMSAEVCKSSFS